MSLAEIVFRPKDLTALRAEVPNLLKRRSFVAGADAVEVRQACVFVLVHPDAGTRLALRAEVVWVQPDGPGKGVGVELAEVDVAALTAFVESTPSAEEDRNKVAATKPDTDSDDDSSVEAAAPKGLYERVRTFTTRERETAARTGPLPERVALERCYGAAVWETLLQNPQLTPPEVARIARNGTVSKPVLGLIVANGGWLSVGEVQRALLANARVSGTALDRVLKSLSPSDLRRVAQQTAYRAAVRQAAVKLMKG